MPAQLQADDRYMNTAFIMSTGEDFRGPWNQGQGPWSKGEEWNYIEDPISTVKETEGLIYLKQKGSKMTPEAAKKLETDLSERRSTLIKESVYEGEGQWSNYE